MAVPETSSKSHSRKKKEKKRKETPHICVYADRQPKKRKNA
jgi:hypothetical protein